MKAYISISYKKRKEMENEVDRIKKVLNEFNISAFVFVDRYNFTIEEEQEMMLQAFEDINTCDLLIAETTDKGIGIGIEVGYAVAKNKPVIYLRKSEAEHSTTVSGASNYQIIYQDETDLMRQLRSTFKTIPALRLKPEQSLTLGLAIRLNSHRNRG